MVANALNIDGIVKDCSNSIAIALELLQSCTKPYTPRCAMPKKCVSCFSAAVLNGFLVAVTDERPPVPSVYNLDLPQYRKCGKYGGTPQASNPVELECDNKDAIGRYVYVYLPATNYLYFCEAFVYGEREYQIFAV